LTSNGVAQVAILPHMNMLIFQKRIFNAKMTILLEIVMETLAQAITITTQMVVVATIPVTLVQLISAALAKVVLRVVLALQNIQVNLSKNAKIFVTVILNAKLLNSTLFMMQAGKNPVGYLATAFHNPHSQQMT
jgi:hypothetical protein